MVFYKKNVQRFETFGDKAFELQKVFNDEKKAELKGEELILSGDISEYRVTEDDSGRFLLWIH